MNTSTIPLEDHLNQIKKLTDEVSHLKSQLEWFKNQIFGKKSEKIIDDSSFQLLLFDLPKNETPSSTEPVTRSKRTKPSPDKPVIFPADLPVERTVYDVEENDKVCQNTGKLLVKIGEEVTQKLAFRPGSYFIKEIVRPKYAVSGSSEGIVIANLPDSLLSRCKADESLLADILVKKFCDHIPLYRQSQMLSRDNIYLSRQVLSQWTVKCGLALKPLYEVLLKEVLKGRNVFIDEVPIDMLKPGNKKTHKAYMWVMVGGKEGNPALRVYNFRTDRSYSHAAKLLENFEDGVVHSDKYGAYETLANKKHFIWSPCWAHIRRKFFEAEGGDKTVIQLYLKKN